MDNPPDDGPCEVTITAPDRGWLLRFVRQLVEDRLAAAAHVDTMHTTYRWGEVQEANEARARIHTDMTQVREIVERVRMNHPYEVPCVVATPIATGGSDYLDWITTAVSTDRESPRGRC